MFFYQFITKIWYLCVVFCEENNKSARYDGETGRNGYYRATKGHKNDIIDGKNKNAFAKHLEAYRPGKVGDPQEKLETKDLDKG